MLVDVNFAAIWDGVVNPLCTVYLRPYASVRDAHSQSSVVNLRFGAGRVNNGMEEIISIEVRCIPAGIAVTEGTDASYDSVAPGRCRGLWSPVTDEETCNPNAMTTRTDVNA